MSEDFEGRIGDTYHDSVPFWPATASSVGRPNVVVVVLDDMGFGSLGCYGSEIQTPTIDGLAARGVQFNNFHATALCSPTRASLLTGRNHHAVGMAYLSHVDDGYPGYRGRIDHRAATLAEMLVDNGYNTMAVGKWHLAPIDETTAAGPFDQWPLGRGFERYYGFMEALTDHQYPELFYDNHPIDPPATPEDGYHLTTDLIDHSISFLRDQTSVCPEKPFFLYLAFGATHTPFQAPPEFVDKYRGAYDEGWDVIRQRRFQRQLELGVIPADTRLPAPNQNVQAWDDLPSEERQLYARFQEVYSGFLDHTDSELGRLLNYLRTINRYDNTIIVVLSDNGASQEGGLNGVLNTTAYENGDFPTLAENLSRADEVDGSRTHINYPLGWAQAGNTPLKRYKQNTHAGGIRTSMITRLPQDRWGGQKIGQFQHVTDIVPTVLDFLGLEAPSTYRGLEQMPIDGRSMRAAIEGVASAPPPRTQYFETVGHRAIWVDGWKAVAYHQRGTPFDSDSWELYNVDKDFSECNDLADTEPEKLRELTHAWWAEARRNKVLPLEDRGFAERTNAHFRAHSPRARQRFEYWNGMQHLGTGAAPPVPNRSFEITARVRRRSEKDCGVLIAHGSVNSGYCLLVEDNHLVYDFNHYGTHHLLRSSEPVPTGSCTLAMRFVKDSEGTGGTATVSINGRECATMALAATFEHYVAFQGLDVGADRLSPVRHGGIGEFAFAGELERVVVTLIDESAGRHYEPMD